MEKEKSPLHGGAGGNLPPSPARYSGLSATSNSFIPSKCEASSATSQSASAGLHAGQFSHDVSQMPDFPTRNVGHRRAHSVTLSLPDDINFDSDLWVVGSGEGPSFSDDTEEDLMSMFIDIDNFASSSVSSGLDLSGAEISSLAKRPGPQSENPAVASNEKPRIRHQHSQSMDETSIKPEMLSSGIEGMSLAETKKAMSAAKLADLALIDPKRAKRIWANRQSAARSKERKMRYIAELERKVQILQTEATTISAQLTMLQQDNTGLTAENGELKVRLQTMEQQVRLQDALNDALREEVQRLKTATGQSISNGGSLLNYGQPSFGGNQQFFHYNQMQSLMAAQQLQQRQMHQQIQRQHQAQPLQQQSTGEVKTRGMTSQAQRDSSSENKTLLE